MEEKAEEISAKTEEETEEEKSSEANSENADEINPVSVPEEMNNSKQEENSQEAEVNH